MDFMWTILIAICLTLGKEVNWKIKEAELCKDW